MPRISPPRAVFEIADILAGAGKSCFLVGGAVRDYLLGRDVSDFDLATEAVPEETMRLFRRVVPTGVRHGTVTILYKGLSVETTTFRSESDYSDGRHPDRVSFASTIDEDLSRRDFTINAMAFDLRAKRLVDPHGGQTDLSRRLIRAVGDPLERFREDGLRPLRAVRFAAQLEFDIEAATFAAIPRALDRLALVSAERVRDEFQKILLARRPSRGIRLMEDSLMLGEVLPELAACRGVEQKGMHRFDVLDHLLESADASPPELALRLAALFHDIGKPAAKVDVPGGEPTFHGHEELSARQLERLMRRLRFPTALIEETAHLVRCHMFSYDDSWSDAAVRRFLARVGTERVERLFALRLADGSGMTGIPADPRSLGAFRERIERVLSEDHAFGLKDLAIGGEELASLGVPRGKVMGLILKELLETVLDDPSLNEAERLKEIAVRLKDKYGLS
ncbi:MAG TPA: CCA tRNA nucleotidyltransferase [Rectinemataceae bacterium]|nr:CCA tRNA nucleotidyltransferase [Rectinemataceae bacterium]